VKKLRIRDVVVKSLNVSVSFVSATSHSRYQSKSAARRRQCWSETTCVSTRTFIRGRCEVFVSCSAGCPGESTNLYKSLVVVGRRLSDEEPWETLRSEARWRPLLSIETLQPDTLQWGEIERLVQYDYSIILYYAKKGSAHIQWTRTTQTAKIQNINTNLQSKKHQSEV